MTTLENYLEASSDAQTIECLLSLCGAMSTVKKKTLLKAGHGGSHL
jgi:hypothetical protein